MDRDSLSILQHAVRFGVSSARSADAKLTKTIERGMTAWLKTLT